MEPTICKVAFYPCCASDFRQPMMLLADYADLVIFCDIDPDKKEKYREFCSKFKNIKPKHQFICGDAQDIVKTLSRIDVLFHRNDSWGREEVQFLC